MRDPLDTRTPPRALALICLLLAAPASAREPQGASVGEARAHWKPDDAWLATDGARYGRLLIFSDLHVGSGVDPETGLLAALERFRPDKQEADLRGLLESEWSAAKTDGKVRTLVGNGDIFELLFHARAPLGRSFKAADRYGPTNTARNAELKLQATAEGHPLLWQTFAEHLARGHRLVYVVGNHDRQVLAPSVRARLRELLRDALCAHLESAPAFAPTLSGDARTRAARRKARARVAAQVEFQPLYFIHGDVFVQHGHESDPANAFSTLAGEFFRRPFDRDTAMEETFGDRYARAVLTNVLQRVPWGGEHGASTMSVAWAALRRKDLKPSEVANLARALLYTVRHENQTSPTAQGSQTERSELTALVQRGGLTSKLNALRDPANPRTETQTIDALLEYEDTRAVPLLDGLSEKRGPVARGLTLLRRLASDWGQFLNRSEDAHEAAGHRVLVDKLGIRVNAKGHRHFLRRKDDPAATAATTAGTGLFEASTWIDPLANRPSRTKNRALITVDFDAEGSHPALVEWNRATRTLDPVPPTALHPD